MEENKPLLEKKSIRTKIANNGTSIKIMIYVVLNSIALAISGSAETQYIYHYVKTNEFRNRTDVKSNQSFSNSSFKSCDAGNGNNSTNSDDAIQARATDWSWYITLVEYGIATIVIIFVGPTVDNIGRKPLLLWNVGVTFIAFVVKSIVISLDLSVYYFMIGSGVEGLSGTYLTFNLASLAILADITSKGKERTFIMALYDAVLGLGMFISFVGVGYLIQFEGYLYPFVISAIIFFLFTILIAVTLKDSWKPPKREPRLKFSQIPIQIFSLCMNKENRKSNLSYFLIHMLIFLLSMLPYSSFSTIRTIYTLGWPFCWTSEHIGWYSASADLVLMVGGTIILKIIHNFCTFIKDELIVIVSLLSSVASLVLLGISNEDWMIYGATAVGALKMLPIPILKAILSRISHPEKQGAVMSNIYLIETASTLGGSTLFNNVYVQTVSLYSGFVFLPWQYFQFWQWF